MQNLIEQFPHLQLEGKLNLEGSVDRAPDVRPRIKNVYVRKRKGIGPKPNDEGPESEENMNERSSPGGMICN